MSKSNKLTVSEAEIALRAYQIWEAEGKPAAKDFDHWLRAEAELAATAKKPAAKRAPVRRTSTKRA